MKVAQLLYSGVGGHGSVAFSLISGDSQRSWSNTLCFIGIEPLHPIYRRHCQQRQIACAYVPTTAGRPQKSWRKVYSWLSGEGPDALIVHSTTVLLPCLLYGAIRNVPVIAVEHTSVAVKRRRDWLLSAIAMLFADRVVMVSEAYAFVAAKRLGRLFRRSKACVIPNGINTAFFTPPAAHGTSNVATLGMAARFTPVKNQIFLVDVTRILRQTVAGVRWRLTLAGAGEELAAAQRHAARVAPKSVSFEGVLGEADLAEWYRSLTVYVHSSDGEALSTSILQAMATGLPIVASDVSGIRGQVTTDFGVLLPNGEPERWAAAIAEIALDRVKADRMGKCARWRCEETYSEQKMHTAYDRIIREAAESH